MVSVVFANGISLADIMRTADLSSDSPFKRFYYKPSVDVANVLFSCD